MTMCKHIVPEWLSNYIQPHLVRKALHLHLTSSFQKGATLTSDLIFLERLCTYIRTHLVKETMHLHLIMWEHIPQLHQNGYALIMWEHIP